MPLVKSRSKAAFHRNIVTEVTAGTPQKQAVAIAYSVQRRAGRKTIKPTPRAPGGEKAATRGR